MTIPNRVIEGQALSRDGVEEQWVTAVREAILELFGGVAGRDITGAVFFGDGVNSVEAVTPPSVSDGSRTSRWYGTARAVSPHPSCWRSAQPRPRTPT